MPKTISSNAIITQMINVLGSTLFPLSLSLLLPIFMYSIVLEKEDKLIQIMKMNGMKMWVYWFVNFIFNYCLQILMTIVFFIFGLFALRITYFTQTNVWIQMMLYAGWGFGQIS